VFLPEKGTFCPMVPMDRRYFTPSTLATPMFEVDIVHADLDS